jgi:uncharacterized protein YoaH (UPF0181 family)
MGNHEMAAWEALTRGRKYQAAIAATRSGRARGAAQHAEAMVRWAQWIKRYGELRAQGKRPGEARSMVAKDMRQESLAIPSQKTMEKWLRDQKSAELS